MTTLMNQLQARIETAVNKTGTYNEALQNLANLYGVPQGETGSRLIPVAQDFVPGINNATAAQNYFLQNSAVAGSGIPSMGLDFTSTSSLDPRITFTRASTGTYFDAAGVLQSAGNNVARFDYDPATLAPRGLLIEEQRTNSIRNNTMQGAVAGTPGTLPTNWSIGGSGLGTLSSQVVGTGTVNGITYVDWRIFGTTSTTDTALALEVATQIAALQGQTWSNSFWLAIVGGSISNITDVNVNTAERNSSGGILGQFNSAGVKAALSATLQRFSLVSTLAQATTAFIQPRLNITFSSGVAIDITLRIGLPQLEQGAFATSVIPTTTAAATRLADSASMTGANFSSWYNASEGTLFAEGTVLSDSRTNAAIFGVANGAANSSASDHATVRYTGGASNVSRLDVTSTTSIFSYSPTNTAGVRKLALAMKSSDFAGCANGGAVSSQASGTLPTTFNQALIGSVTYAATGYYCGHIRRIMYYNTRLSNAQLQAITS